MRKDLSTINKVYYLRLFFINILPLKCSQLNANKDLDEFIFFEFVELQCFNLKKKKTKHIVDVRNQEVTTNDNPFSVKNDLSKAPILHILI
jgi:hypothetical protein